MMALPFQCTTALLFQCTTALTLSALPLQTRPFQTSAFSWSQSFLRRNAINSHAQIIDMCRPSHIKCTCLLGYLIGSMIIRSQRRMTASWSPEPYKVLPEGEPLEVVRIKNSPDRVALRISVYGTP